MRVVVIVVMHIVVVVVVAVVVMHVVPIVVMRGVVGNVTGVTEIMTVAVEIMTVTVEIVTCRVVTRRRETIARRAAGGGVGYAALMRVAGRDVTAAGGVMLIPRHEHRVQTTIGIREVHARDIARVKSDRQCEGTALVVRRGNREVTIVAEVRVVMCAVTEEQDHVIRHHADTDNVVRDIADGQQVGTRAVDGVQIERVADADRVVIVVRVHVAVLVDGHSDDLADAFAKRHIEMLRVPQVDGGFAVALGDGAIGPPEVSGVGNIDAQTDQVLRRFSMGQNDRSLIATIGEVRPCIKSGSNHRLRIGRGRRERKSDSSQNGHHAIRAFLNLGHLVVGGGR